MRPGSPTATLGSTAHDLLAVSAAWPAVLAGVAVVVAVCLWLLFRPGSMADRARGDHPADDVLDDRPPGLRSDGGTRRSPDHPPTGGR